MAKKATPKTSSKSATKSPKAPAKPVAKPSAKPAKRPPARAKAAAAGTVSLELGLALAQLLKLGDAGVRKQNAKGGAWGPGAGDNQFGVKHGDIRALAKKFKPGNELATALWATANIDAQYLAVLLFKAKDLSAEEVDGLVRTVTFGWVAEWLTNYVVKQHPGKESLRLRWMQDDDRWAARAGWGLTAERVAKDPAGLDIPGLLTRIESELPTADPVVQWTMNATLAEIGIRFAEHRPRAIAIGEKIGLYRDHPVSKGCTSPFAPIWINHMVARKG